MTNARIEALSRLIRLNGVVLDTNVLLLRMLVDFDPALIGRGRLDVFSLADAHALDELTADARQFVTSPHILAEVINLGMQSVPRRRHHAFLTHAADVIQSLDERFVPAAKIVERPMFRRLGLTDAGLAVLQRDPIPVISVDAPLVHALDELGVHVLNLYNLSEV